MREQRVRWKINESYVLIWWIICATVSWTTSVTQISNSKLKTVTWYFIWKGGQYICQFNLYNLWLGILCNTEKNVVICFIFPFLYFSIPFIFPSVWFSSIFSPLFVLVYFSIHCMLSLSYFSVLLLCLPALHCHYISDLLNFFNFPPQPRAVNITLAWREHLKMYFHTLLTRNLKHFPTVKSKCIAFVFVVPIPEQSNLTGVSNFVGIGSKKSSRVIIMFCIWWTL